MFRTFATMFEYITILSMSSKSKRIGSLEAWNSFLLTSKPPNFNVFYLYMIQTN